MCTAAAHVSHMKTPSISSGRTSDVRVTVPAKLISRAILAVLRSRMLSCVCMLKKHTQKSLSSVAYSSCSRFIRFFSACRRKGSR